MGGSGGARGLLYPLDRFYAREGRALPEVEPVEGGEIPEPYRGLLVHERDMTPTLEAFHGERIHLRLIDRVVEGDALWRLVVLTLDGSERAVEFGAIAIHMECFPEGSRPVILGCRCPLGTILADFGVAHQSRPQAYLRVRTEPAVEEALGLGGPAVLYGRRNVLSTPDGCVLAEVLEILPPAGEEGRELR